MKWKTWRNRIFELCVVLLLCAVVSLDKDGIPPEEQAHEIESYQQRTTITDQ